MSYDRFYDVKHIAKGRFGTVYKAKWKGGYTTYWDINKCEWKRYCPVLVILKNLDNSQNITLEFINEVMNLLFSKYNDLLM